LAGLPIEAKNRDTEAIINKVIRLYHVGLLLTEITMLGGKKCCYFCPGCEQSISAVPKAVINRGLIGKQTNPGAF
jgi:hypothetical protein